MEFPTPSFKPLIDYIHEVKNKMALKKKTIFLGIIFTLIILSIFTVGAMTRISDEEIFTTGTLSVGELEVDGMLNSNWMLKIKKIDLPNCNMGKEGSIARNETTLYYCDGADWRALALK